MNSQNNEELRIVLGEPGQQNISHRNAPDYGTVSYDQNAQYGQYDPYVVQGEQPGARQSTGGDVKEFVRKSFSVTVKYFAAKLLVSVIITVGCFIVLSLLHVRLSLVWAILAGVGNFIPVFGQWIGMLGCIGGAWAMSGDWKVALYTLLTIIVLQILDEFLLTPLLVGKATSIKPLLVIVVMLAASSLLGFWGIMFAVPIAAIIKLGFDIFYRRKKNGEQ